MCYACFNVYALYYFASKSSSSVYSLKAFASQTSILSGILLVHPYPQINIFHMSPPYLPIRGISLPLLKYIIHVLSLNFQNLLFCASDLAHEETVGNS